jgi:predicted sulfurtransferase
MSTPVVLNVAAYLFSVLDDPASLRPEVMRRCLEAELKGTVHLAHEGINLFLAGAPQAVDSVLAWLRCQPGLERLSEKRQFSDQVPFKHMWVKLKRELVPSGDPDVMHSHPAPRIDADLLKHWLDSGKPFVLLDTRNQFEFEQGAFERAVTLELGHFNDFRDKVAAKLEQWRDQTIVTFCTGGIRCEKAAPIMRKLGFQHVLQLDGGILKYFEQCGDAHFRGDCFVFDERVGVDAALKPRQTPSASLGQIELASVIRQVED